MPRASWPRCSASRRPSRSRRRRRPAPTRPPRRSASRTAWASRLARVVMAVAVVTDTTHYLPPGLLADLGVREVSLYVGWDGGLRRESEITDLGAFYDDL